MQRQTLSCKLKLELNLQPAWQAYPEPTSHTKKIQRIDFCLAWALCINLRSRQSLQVILLLSVRCLASNKETYKEFTSEAIDSFDKTALYDNSE